MAQRKRPPARPAKRRSGPVTASGQRSGGRVSGSVSVAPKLTIFGGGLLSINFGGGGKGGRGKGGLFKRVAGLVGKGLSEMRGKPSGGKGSGAPAGGGRSFDDFCSSRPDLVLGGSDDDLGDEGDDQGDDDAYRMPDQSGGDQGHHWRADCPECGRAPGTGHAYECPSWLS